MTYELKQYKTEHGIKTVIVGPKARKYMPILMMDKGLIVKKVPITEERYLSDVIQTRKPMSLKTAINRFKKFGRMAGSTKAARQFMKRAVT